MPAHRSNLQYLLKKMRVNILHISCHGERKNLIFQSEKFGYVAHISIEEFKEELRAAKHEFQCLVVMACHSQDFADAATPYAEFTVGIYRDKEVNNRAAEIFSERFYDYLLKGFTYEDSYKEAIKCVEENFRHCNCDQESSGSNSLFPCRKMHITVKCNCNQEDTKINRHSSTCKPPNTVKLLSRKEKNWLCCCGCNHAESEKFVSFKGRQSKTSKIGQIPESIVADQFNESESSGIRMPDCRPYYTPNLQLMRLCSELIPEKKQIEAYFIYGEKGVGKSCFVKKLVGYLSQRTFEQSGNRSPLYKDWIYLDLGRCESLLQFQAGCSITRAGITYHTLKAIIDYSRQRRCIIVLDHCTKLAGDCPSQFKQMLKTQICQLQCQGSKVILLANDQQQTQWMKGQFTTFSFSLREEQWMSIFVSITKANNYLKKNLQTLAPQKIKVMFENTAKAIKPTLPTDLNKLIRLFSNSPSGNVSDLPQHRFPEGVTIDPKVFLEELEKYSAMVKRQKDQLEAKQKNVSNWMKASQCEQCEQRSLFFLAGFLKGMLTQDNLKELQVYINGISHPTSHITELLHAFLPEQRQACYQSMIESANDDDLRNATKLLLRFYEICFTPILSQISTNKEQPFSVSPLLLNSSQSPELTDPPSFMINLSRSDLTRLIEALLDHTSVHKAPNRKVECLAYEGDGKDLGRLRWLLVRVPLIKLHLEGSLKSEFVYQVFHSLERTYQLLAESPSTADLIEVCCFLLFARAEERAPIRKEWETVKKYLRLNIPLESPKKKCEHAKARQEYLKSFLSLQVEYLCSAKFLGDTDWKVYIDSLKGVADNYEKLHDQNQLDNTQEIRHAIYYSHAIMIWVQRRGCSLPSAKIVEDIILQLKGLKEQSKICKLKYYQCRFLLEKEIKKTRSCAAYKNILSELESDLASELGQQEVYELRYSLSEELACLESSLVKIMTAKPIDTQNSLRMADAWITDCFGQLRRNRKSYSRLPVSIEWGVLTFSALSQTLLDEFRLLFLRVDLTPEGEIEFESEDKLGMVDRHPLKSLKILSFNRIDVLVVCGRNSSLLLGQIEPKNLIAVELKQQKGESVYGNYLRERIQQEYCADFLVQFTSSLLLEESEHGVGQVYESLILAQHAATIKACQMVPPDSQIAKFVTVSNSISQNSQHYPINIKEGDLSIIDDLSQCCLKYETIGCQLELMSVLKMLGSGGKGKIVNIVGSRKLAEEFSKQVFFRLKRARLVCFTYSERQSTVDVSAGHCYIFNLPNSKPKWLETTIKQAVKKGCNVLMVSSEPINLTERGEIVELKTNQLEEERNLYVALCRLLERYYNQPFARLAPEVLERILQGCLKQQDFDLSKDFSRTQLKNLGLQRRTLMPSFQTKGQLTLTRQRSMHVQLGFDRTTTGLVTDAFKFSEKRHVSNIDMEAISEPIQLHSKTTSTVF